MYNIFYCMLAFGAVSFSDAWCPTNFEELGSQCYYFSHHQEQWHEANGVCEGLGFFLGVPVTLAVLDVGLDTDMQNKLLLSKLIENGEDSWLGGYAADGTTDFTWVDGRAMDPTYSYWYYNEPSSTTGNCAAAQMSISGDYKRFYLYSRNCSDNYSVVCQTTPIDVQPKPECPSPFEGVGGYCVVFSKNLGVSPMSWEDSRSYCQAMETSTGSVDLAVLGLEGQQDQQLLSAILATGGVYTWLGGRVESGNDTMYWHDGRPVDPTAYYWMHNNGPSGSTSTLYGTTAHVYTYEHSTVKNLQSGITAAYDFVCQIF